MLAGTGEDVRYDQYLTMLGPQDPVRIKTAYEKVMVECGREVDDGMCWPVEWFPEHLPVESATGNSLYYYVENLSSPMDSISNWPPVDRQNVRKEDVLIFQDSYGYCKEIIEHAPPGRVGFVNWQKPAEKLQEKDIKDAIKMNSWDLIIFGAGIDPPPSNSVEDVNKQQAAITKAFLTILKAIEMDGSRCKRLAVVTVDTFAEERDIHEECGLGLITNCTLFGMCNTARQEIPKLPIQYIDTEWGLQTENSKYLSSEIFRHLSFGCNTVRILNRGRYVLRQVPSKPYENLPDWQLPNEGTIAISGGNGALGLVMGGFLLDKAKEQGNKHFSVKFLSRSMKISDQNMPHWKAIEAKAAALGITVEQAQCDLSKQSSVDEFIKANTPNIVGFIHSAGILQDSMLMNQTWEKFEAVYDSKSRAALYVHDAMERYENPWLEFFWMFSSLSVYGSMGQLNYSSSNSWLDGLARHRRALGKPALAPQWGAWGDVGMAANLDDANRRRMANSPMPYFSNEEGLWGLGCLLRSNLAYGCVHKMNSGMMFGMVYPDEEPNQCYVRNFFSQVCPPPPGEPTKNPYMTLSYTMRQTSHLYQRGIVFQAYWPKLAEALQDME